MVLLDMGELGGIIGVLEEWHHQVPHVLAEGAQVLLKGLLHLLQKINLRFWTCCAKVIVIGVALDPSNDSLDNNTLNDWIQQRTQGGTWKADAKACLHHCYRVLQDLPTRGRTLKPFKKVVTCGTKDFRGLHNQNY